MTKHKLRFCLIFLIFCLPIAFAQESGPQLPHIFYGSSKINGIDTPAGTVIIAKVNEIEKGRITTTETGKYGGQPANQDKLLVQGNIEEGATIEFYISGVKANEAHSFESGDVAEKSLTWTFPSTIEIVQTSVSNEPITCVPGTTIEVSIPGLELDISCDTPTVGTLNNITDLGGTYFVGTPGGTAPVSNSIEISVSGDFDVVATMSYDDAGIDESTVAVYKYVNGSWAAIPSSDIISIDTVNNKIIFRVSPGTPHAGFGLLAPASAAPASGSGGSVEVSPATTTTTTPKTTPKTDVTTTTTIPANTTTTLPEETTPVVPITPATAEPGNLITGLAAFVSSPTALAVGIAAIGAALAFHIKRKQKLAKKQDDPATANLEQRE